MRVQGLAISGGPGDDQLRVADEIQTSDHCYLGWVRCPVEQCEREVEGPWASEFPEVESEMPAMQSFLIVKTIWDDAKLTSTALLRFERFGGTGAIGFTTILLGIFWTCVFFFFG